MVKIIDENNFFLQATLILKNDYKKKKKICIQSTGWCIISYLYWSGDWGDFKLENFCTIQVKKLQALRPRHFYLPLNSESTKDFWHFKRQNSEGVNGYHFGGRADISMKLGFLMAWESHIYVPKSSKPKSLLLYIVLGSAIG